MRVLLAIAAFELRSRFKLVSTYVYFLLYAAIAAFWMAAAGGAIESAHVSFGGEKVLINGPYALAQLLTLAGFMGISVIAAFMGRAMQQDFEHGTFHFFYTAPIRKFDYVLGRFLGAYCTLLIIFAGVGLGAEIGIHLPGIEAARVGPDTLGAFLRPYAWMLLPNMLWMGGLFFMMAALTRQMAPVYITGVLVLIGYLLSLGLIGNMDNKTRAALLDPVGSMALSVLTRYWSVADRNLRPLPLEGVLLWNRLIWTGFGVAVFTLGYRRLKLDFGGDRSGKNAQPSAPAPRAAALLPMPAYRATPPRWLAAAPVLMRLYLREIVRSPRFAAVVIGGTVFMLGSAATIGAIYGTNTWPVTWQVLEFTSGLFGLFILVVTAIYGGELVWRERDARMDEIVDAAPYPDWLPLAAKLVTLFAVQALLLAVVLVAGAAIQLWYGYTNFELGHALYELYVVQLPGYFMLAVLALAIHVVVNNKYVGHFLVGLWFVLALKLPDLGYEDRLYLYGAMPTIQYSDMNGYGHFLPALRWFQLYWSAWALVLLVPTYLLWVRGRESNRHARGRLARARFGAKPAAVALAALALAAASGGWIWHNTHQLNHFRSTDDGWRLQAEYEKRYKIFDGAPQPHVTAIDLQADIFPAELRARLRGTYALVNRDAVPIADLYVVLPPGSAEVASISADSALTLADAAPELGWRHYRLAQPLAPGVTTHFTFDLGYAVHGFRNDGASDIILGNGTFINGAFGRDVARLPGFGYDASMEIASDRERKKFGLAPKERMRDLDDPRGRNLGVDWIDHYGATLSTDAGQTAITSGVLEKQWSENGRSYFRYRMDGRAIAFVPVLSGAYAVKRDRWQGPQQAVDIEIDYHAGHEFDLERMVAGVKDSLDYFTKNYSPYQHPLLRIVEFPRYQRFAESFPNTVPYSEAIGFIARVDDSDPKDIDYPYFVTAHEVAHQWWGHQETPADVQGAEFIVESLAEYSALMVLKHKYGDAKMHRFLQYELDRYLLGRGSESKKEQPLLRADGPTYLHYQKGSLALYALQDAIGEDAVNRALSAFVDEWKFRGPPYPLSRDLLAEFRKVTPPQQQYLIEDLFETITLYELRATAAHYRALPGGKFEVTLTAEAKKLRADGLGTQTEISMDELVDVGALDAEGLPLLLTKQRVHSGSNTLTFTVDQLPAKAGIDPLNKLINRHSTDGVTAVVAQ